MITKVTDETLSLKAVEGFKTKIMRNNYLSSYSSGKEDDYLEGMSIINELGEDQLFQSGKHISEVAKIVADMDVINEDTINDAMEKLGISSTEELNNGRRLKH